MLVTGFCVVRQQWTVRKDTGVRQPPPGTAATDHSAKYGSTHLDCGACYPDARQCSLMQSVKLQLEQCLWHLCAV